MSRLKSLYKDEIVDAMIKKFGYKNVMEVPKLDKIVVSMVAKCPLYTPPAVENLSYNHVLCILHTSIIIIRNAILLLSQQYISILFSDSPC